MAQNIDPNLAVKEEKKPESLPEQLEKNIVKRIKDMLRMSNAATKDLRQKWADNYAFVVEGKQWSLNRPRWRFKEVLNITWANIMTEVGIETDQLPKFDYEAQEPSDYAFADVLTEINDANWAKPTNRGFGWQNKLIYANFLRKVCDVVHAEITWDRKLEDGIGDVSFKILNPFGCFWDPVAKDISESRYFIYIEPRPTSELRSQFPDMQIKPDFAPMGESRDQLSDYNKDYTFGPTGPNTGLWPNQIAQRINFGGEDMTLKQRIWLKDESTVDIEEQNPEKPEEKLYVKKKKYPKGRYLEIINDKIVKDEGENGEFDSYEPNIFKDGLFPIAALKNYDYGDYAGQNEVDHQKGVQMSVNYAISHIMDQFKIASNPQLFATEKAWQSAQKYTSEPGLVIKTPTLNDMRLETGPGIASGSFNVLDSLLGLHDKVSGMSDSAGRGIPDSSVGSGVMLDAFQMIAQTRTRLKSRTLADFLGQIGYLCTSRYLQFYTDKRAFRVTNKQGFPEFVDFFITEDQQGNMTADVTRTVNAQGEFSKMSPQQIVVKGIPDVSIKVGSNLPFSKRQKMQEAKEAYDRGLVTGEAYLSAIDWPNPSEEFRKAQEERAQQQPTGA